MNLRVLRPVATVAALALTLSAGLVPTAASAQQHVFGQWSTQNDQGQRQIAGTVTYFSQYDLRIAGGSGRYGNAGGSGRYGNAGGQYGNGNGQRRRHHRRHDNDDQNGQGRNGQYGNGQYGNGQYGNGQYGNGQYPNGQQYPSGGRQYPNGGRQYPNGQNGQYGRNGRYGNGQYNGNEQRIHLHQGTVINPRGTTLQNGMQIRVWGHPNADGTFEADRIDVVNGQGQGYYR